VDADDPPLPPPLTPSQPPLYHTMGEHSVRLERMTRRLLADEAELENVDLFGVPGQGQWGIDVLAHKVGGGRVVASCKCYEHATPSLLKAWSKAFLDERAEHWPDVDRFILVTAARDITSVKNHDQIVRERTRFAAVNVAYEVWGPEQLTDRFGLADRSVAQRMLGPYWATELHGPPRPTDDPSAATIARLNRLHTVVSDQVAARLAAVRDRLSAGDEAAVVQFLGEVRAPALWSQLLPAVQGAAIRLDAHLAHWRDDDTRARALLADAEAIAPDENRLLAQLENRVSGPAAGLALLQGDLSRAGRHVRALLLLADNQVAAAEAEVDRLLADDADDPESQRLLALIRIYQNRRVDALAAARQAEALAPHWLAVQRTVAFALYGLAISPLADPAFAQAPNPIEPLLVRFDEESQAGLTEAVARFQRLAQTPHAPEADQHWLLAALCLHRDRRAEANALAQSMLTASPDEIPAVIWVIETGLDVDLEPAQRRLSQAYAAGAADELTVRALMRLLLRRDGWRAAREVLAAGLEDQDGEARVEALRWQDQFAGAEAAETAAVGQGPPEPLPDEAAELAETLGATPPRPIGLRLATVVAQEGRLALLATYVAALEAFDTEAAINIGLYVLHRTAAPADVLAYFERHAARFVYWAAQSPVQRLVARVRFENGDIPGALQQAQALAARTGAIADALVVATFHIASGYAQAAAPAIREGVRQEALAAGEAIRFSLALTREDHGLAVDLWRYASAKGLPDDHLTIAITQAHKLGLDAELGPMMARLHARAAEGAGDAWIVTLDDLPEKLREWRERDRDVGDLYEQGAVPIHLVAGALNLNLGQFYWLDGRAAARGPLQPLLIRHGARQANLAPDVPWAQWRLHMDITSLLLAEQLGLLEALGDLTGPIMVSRSLTDILYDLEQRATHQQAVILDAARAIVNAHQARQLTHQTTPATDDVTVQHERLRQESATPGPTVRSVMEVLAGLGEVDQLPVTAEDQVATAPALGQRLVFPDNTLESVATLGGLPGVLARFRCEIPQAVLDELNATLVRAEAGETLADRITALRRFVAAELAAGRFRPLAEALRADGADDPDDVPDPDDEELDADADTAQRRRPFEQALADLLDAPRQPNGMVWCDDRLLSGYTNTQGNVLVGVVEVLNGLVAAGRLTEGDRRAKLQQLRAGGAAFIPFRVDEVTAPLKAAPIDSVRGVIETRALAIMRRNLSTAASLDPKMKIGESAHATLAGQPDELPFLVSAWQILKDALIEVWQDGGATLADCEARSDWLWANLRLHRTLRSLPGDADLLAMLIVGSLYVAAAHMTMPGRKAAKSARRRAFSAWLTKVAVTPREEAMDVKFLDAVADQIGRLVAEHDTLRDQLQGTPEEIDEFLAQMRRIQIVLAPESIRQRLLARPDFAAATGAVRAVVLGPLEFDAERFWPACLRALRHGRARLRTSDEHAVQLRGDDSELLIEADGKTLRFRDPVLAIVKAPRAERRAAIAAHCVAYDLAPEDEASIKREALRARGPLALVDVLADVPRRSVLAHYSHLDTLFANGEINEHLEAFRPPPARQLLHFLRLTDGDGPVADRTRAAFGRLADQIGQGHAFVRLGGLPVDLASVMAPRLAAAGQTSADLGPPPASPVMRLHLAAVCRRLGEAEPSDIIESLIDDLDTEGDLFAKLLAWTEMAFQSDADWRALDAGEQLALIWAHAHRVTAAVIVADVDPAPATAYFSKRPPKRTLAGILSSQAELKTDCASPNVVFSRTVLLHGLAYVFGDGAPKTALPDLAERLEAAFRSPAHAEMPDIGLLTRSPQAGNAMHAFLDLTPSGVPETLDPPAIRAEQLEKATAALDENPADRQAWVWLHAAGAPQVPTALKARVVAAFDRLELKDIAGTETELPIAPVIVAARRQYGGPIPDDIAHKKLADLVEHSAFAHPGAFDSLDGSPAAHAFSEAVEVAAALARRTDTAEAIAAMALHAHIIASYWPAAAAPLRRLLDEYIRQTPREDAAALWEAFLSLRRWA